MLHPFGNQLLGFEHDLALVQGGVVYAIDSALASLLPTLHPIGNIQTTVHAELAVGSQDAPDESFVIDHLEARAARPERERMHATVGAAAAEIHEEEVTLIFVRQAGARVIAQNRGTVGGVGNRRN